MEEEKSYQKIRKEFYNRYEKFIIPTLEKYENDRKKMFKSISTMIIIFIIVIMFPVSVITLIIHTFDAFIVFLYFLVGVSFTSSMLYFMVKKIFENIIKIKIMSKICTCFPNLIWKKPNFLEIYLKPFSKYANFPINFTNDISGYDYKVSNLIPSFSKIFFDDCFNGEHNNVKFTIMETETQTENKNAVFKGVIITLDMNKNFKGNTIIRVDSIFHTAPSENLHHTVLEDIEFEKKFDVFTDDDVEARYLITPSFMERLKSMQVAFMADKISVSFYKNKFFIALYTNKDLFALGSLTKKVCDEKQFLIMFEEILSIIRLIDHFKLNQNIGM